MEEYLRDLLGTTIFVEVVNSINLRELTEIRLRVSRKICIRSRNEKIKLKIATTEKIIDEIIGKATKHSPYAYNDEMISGYIKTTHGIRIGVVGRYVCSNDKILSIKQVTSLNIRVPHEIIGAGLELSNILSNFDNTIIVAPPGGGKTTLIRDFARVLSNTYDLVIIDERDEITAGGKFTFGDCVDIVSGVQKTMIGEAIIRSMSPEIVVMDEIYLDRDLEMIEYLSRAGIYILAAIHGSSNDRIVNRLIDKTDAFAYAVILSKVPRPGTIEKVLRFTK
ncbi:MAG: hypothetical protein LBF68_05800 [Christensenellaceae bacterium]|jgi:stage III sporulation protein AA|nr:hypothetical protein [Christensenellaceae bacterium]